MNKYTRLFIDESRVYIPDIAAIVGRLRAGCPGESDAREGQRLSHSLKGMALFERQPGIAALTAAMERGFEVILGNGAGGALVEGLEAAVPVLGHMIDEVEADGVTRADPTGLVAAIDNALGGGAGGVGHAQQEGGRLP